MEFTRSFKDIDRDSPEQLMYDTWPGHVRELEMRSSADSFSRTSVPGRRADLGLAGLLRRLATGRPRRIRTSAHFMERLCC